MQASVQGSDDVLLVFLARGKEDRVLVSGPPRIFSHLIVHALTPGLVRCTKKIDEMRYYSFPLTTTKTPLGASQGGKNFNKVLRGPYHHHLVLLVRQWCMWQFRACDGPSDQTGLAIDQVGSLGAPFPLWKLSLQTCGNYLQTCVVNSGNRLLCTFFCDVVRHGSCRHAINFHAF